MRELILSPEAEQDVIDIWLYIAEDSPVNADHYTDKLYDKGVILAENPKIGTERTDPNFTRFKRNLRDLLNQKEKGYWRNHTGDLAAINISQHRPTKIKLVIKDVTP